MTLTVRIDDLTSPEVHELVKEHLAGMHGNTPACQVHALAVDKLKTKDITFFTAWLDGALCGCGAVRELDAATGEVKSMRTRAAFLRKGVGQAVLDEIVRTAKRRGYRRLVLETGTGPAFDAAHALYLRNGFSWCGAFGSYEQTDFNVFMQKELAPAARARDLAIPLLPSRSIAATLAFYERLGFAGEAMAGDTYAIATRGELELHFFLHRELRPEQSHFQCYLRVGDANALHRAFAKAGLPANGIPRLTPVETKPWGMLEFALVDGDGTLLRAGQVLEEA